MSNKRFQKILGKKVLFISHEGKKESAIIKKIAFVEENATRIKYCAITKKGKIYPLLDEYRRLKLNWLQKEIVAPKDTIEKMKYENFNLDFIPEED